MKCSVCESVIPDGSEICPICGSILEKTEDPKQKLGGEPKGDIEGKNEQQSQSRKISQKEQIREEASPARVVRKVEQTSTPQESISENAKEAAKNVAQVAKGVANLAIEGAKNLNASQKMFSTTSILNDSRASKHGKVGPFILAENESFIKRYLCADLGFGIFNRTSSTGYLYVTNQRIMYYGKDEKSEICMEAPISSIGGITTFLGNNRDWLKAIIGALLILIGLGLMTSCGAMGRSGMGSTLGGIGTLLGLGVAGVGCIMIYLSGRKAYMLQISSTAVSGTAILIGEGPQSNFMNNKSLYTLTAVPTKDTEVMISEIGALIHDIQMLGDGAIKKWKE